MSIKRLIISIFIVMIFFCGLLSNLVYKLENNQVNLQQSHNKRYQSYLLADELRQSSDDLTRFMRSYATTGDERFKQYYFDVLAIRNGEKPRPINYNRIYWDLFIGDKVKPRGDTESKPLHAMMLEASFSVDELAALEASQNNSDELVKTELIAMNAVTGLYQDAKGNYTRRGPDNRQLAQELLFNEKYHAEKAKIMRPVDQFFSKLDKRTKLEVQQYTELHNLIFNELLALTIFIIIFTILLCYALIHYVLKPLGGEPEVMNEIANNIIEGNLEVPFNKKAKGVYKALKEMTAKLKQHHLESKNRAWLQQGQVSIDRALRSEREQAKMSSLVLTTLARYVNAEVGNIYVWRDNILDNGEGILQKSAVFAQIENPQQKDSYRLNEGLIGQVASEQESMVINKVPAGYLRVHSTTGEHEAAQIALIPFSYMGSLRGVIELAFLEPVSDLKRELLDSLRESIGITFENVSTRENLNETLEEAQNLSEELQTQQEELRVTNESLRSKSKDLVKQHEVLLESKKEIEDKADQLEKSNQYKSEFLANMSHELRTPLNSLLILARSLGQNKKGNLSIEEVYSAEVIHESGCHLLDLINHILDLSKVEAGYMKVYQDNVDLLLLQKQLTDRFSVLANDKKVAFTFTLDPLLPKYIVSDKLRLEQILTNLMGNAIKFTEQGSVKVHASIEQKTEAVKFAISDSGIGIANDQKDRIFSAFQQADGSMTRKYGGTGLGLSISKELANLLGGDISMQSVVNKGSTFCLTIPLNNGKETTALQQLTSPQAPIINKTGTQEHNAVKRSSPDLKILIVEDNDITRAQLNSLLTFEGVYCEFVATGQEAINSVQKQKYEVVILDLNLTNMSGFEALNTLATIKNLEQPEYIVHTACDLSDADLLKLNQYTDKIIVKSDFSSDRLFEEVQELLSIGSNLDVMINKPSLNVEHAFIEELKDNRILLVDDDMRNTFSLAKVLRADGMEVLIATSGKQALSTLAEHPDIDVVIMDMMMPGMDGYETTIKIREQEQFLHLPIIAFTAAVLSKDKEKCLKAGTNDYLTKPVDIQLLYKSMLACL